MDRLSRVLLVCVCGTGLGIGCSADRGGTGSEQRAAVSFGDYSVAETEAMLNAAESVGIDRERIQFTHDEIRAESDMVLDPETLLALAAEHEPNAVAAPGLTPQGYFSRTSITPAGQLTATPPRANSIRMLFDGDVPSAWRTALRDAAAQWNPNVCIDIREDRGDDVISVRVDSTLPEGTLAIAFLPASLNGVVLPGSRISVAPNPPSSPAFLKHVAMHELGHTLGFLHPGQGRNIPGTSIDTTAGAAASYSTVLALSGPTLSGLSSDDIATRDAVFRRITKVVNGRSVTVCPNGTDKIAF
jgi:hypothetical protein